MHADPGAQVKRDTTMIFLNRSPAGVKVLHIQPDFSRDQFCRAGGTGGRGWRRVKHCYFMVGHKMWRNGSAEDVWSPMDPGSWCAVRLLGGVCVPILDTSPVSHGQVLPGRMSCFKCGCPRPRDGGFVGGGSSSTRELSYPGRRGGGVGSRWVVAWPRVPPIGTLGIKDEGGEGRYRGPSGGTDANSTRVQKGAPDTVLSTQAQALEAFKDLPGPEGHGRVACKVVAEKCSFEERQRKAR